MNDEILLIFQEILNNPASTLEDLSQLVEQIPVFDRIAPSDSVTHLYTKMGNNKGFIREVSGQLAKILAKLALEASFFYDRKFAKILQGI